jgi:hypothetical protein
MSDLIEKIPLDISFTEETKNELKINLGKVLERLQLSNKLDNPKTRISIGKTIEFVELQPSDFYSTYLKHFVQDCYQAYDGGDPDNNMSCVQGIVERFALSVGSASFTLCPSNCVEQKLEELESFKNYAKLKELLGFTIQLTKEIIREYCQKWFENYNESPETTNLNKEERTAERLRLLTEFVTEKALELLKVPLNSKNIDMINDTVKEFTYSVEPDIITLGGKKTKKYRKTKKHRKTNKHRKTKKYRKTKKHRKTNKHRKTKKYRKTKK